jgi:hypothetical protein
MKRALSAAEGMRLHRQRRRRGMRSFSILLHVTEIEALVRKGFLVPESRADPDAIRAAVHDFLFSALGVGA